MSFDGNPWPYINQKRKTEEVKEEVSELREENKALRKIITKLSRDNKLTESEKKLLE